MPKMPLAVIFFEAGDELRMPTCSAMMGGTRLSREISLRLHKMESSLNLLKKSFLVSEAASVKSILL
jgi:hypothetical protein